MTTSGNHDITLDTAFYSQYGLYFHSQEPQDAQKCQELLESCKSIVYLRNESATVRLASAEGPRTVFKVFGSPLSPAKGMWAFGYTPEEAPIIWAKIPLDSDIVVTHTPPKYHLDERSDRRSAGCEALRQSLWRVRPKLAVCGHIHESRGAEIVRWDLSVSNVAYKEHGTDAWSDPGKGNKKQSLVDLTSKSQRMLVNDGASGHYYSGKEADDARNTRLPSMDITFTGPDLNDAQSVSSKLSSTVFKGLSQVTKNLMVLPVDNIQTTSRGLGGIPPSRRCDLESLSGRLGRQETCIVNAAIMAKSWPHRRGKVFNKPIVIDLDLPVADD